MGSLVELIRPLLHPLRLTSFLIFVGLGAVVRFSERSRFHRLGTNIFLLYLLLVNLAVAITRTDDWPFSPYGMMSLDARNQDRVASMVMFRAVDGAGREWDIDEMAWSPLFPQAVMGWYEVTYPEASEMDRETVARFLLGKAEAWREARQQRRWVGNQRLLGPFSAPDMNLYGHPAAISPHPFIGLRIYRISWRPWELYSDPQRFERRLLYEYRRD